MTLERRKKHTVKNLYAVNEEGMIIYKSKNKQIGKRHDYNIYKKNYPKLPKDVMSMYDLGFLGCREGFPDRNHPYISKRRRESN